MATTHNEPFNQPTAAPTTKVTAFAVGAALATVAMTLAETFWGVQFPSGFEGALALILGFIAGYFVKERPQG